MSDCTCRVAEPKRHSAVVGAAHSSYAVYLDFIEGETEFDRTCPFHGDNGSMVALLHPSEPRE